MTARFAARQMSLTALVAVLITGSRAYAQLGLISQSQELQAGRDADAQIRRQYKISNDRDYNGLVNHLGKRLVKVCERPDIPWTFRVVDSKDVNAFSVPGYVYVNTGLLQFVGNDQDAVAGVIAHEIGHTCGRHAVKQAEEREIGSLLAGLIGGRNRTVSALSGVALNLVELGHSRGEEFDADKRAVRYTVSSGYDPEGLVRFFQKLQSQEGRGRGGLLTYFQTHPPTPDRIKRVEEEIAKDKKSSTDEPVPVPSG